MTEEMHMLFFKDVLPGETKKAYFKRKSKLEKTRSFLYFICFYMFRQHGRRTLQNLVPDYLGGDADWILHPIEEAPEFGALTVPVSDSSYGLGDNPIYYFFDTSLSKKEYFKKNPPRMKYLQALLRLIYSSLSDYDKDCNHEWSNIVPEEYGGSKEWIVPITKEEADEMKETERKRIEEHEKKLEEEEKERKKRMKRGW
jgi:hypothetical protein